MNLPAEQKPDARTRSVDARTTGPLIGMEESVLLAAIVESSDDAIVSKDLNGIIRSWNKGAERIFGYVAEEVIGRPISILAPPERANEMLQILVRIRAGERVQHYETVRRRKDGQSIIVSLTVSPIRNTAGEIIGASKIARDISEQKKLEAELRKFDAQLMLLANAASALLASPHTSDVVRTIIELAQRFGSADGYAVWRKRASDQLWVLVSSAGLSEEYARTPLANDSVAPFPLQAPSAFEDVMNEPSLAVRRSAFEREGIRSMLVVPLHVQGEPTGTVAFYWRSPHRFTEAEIRIASALGNMAASALGAAELYEREMELRNQAQWAERRATFLAKAGAVLSDSLDYETTLRSVARLAIDRFADWCSVDLSRDGKLERVALEHIDPAKIQLAREYRRKYPPQPDDIGHLALRTGESFLIETIPEDLLRERIPDPEQFAMIRRMGVESLMITPMVSRGRPLGLITFVSTKRDQHYTNADLALAQELSRRAATAIDNARLFADSQRAEAALRKSNEELRHVNEDLNRFAYSASHDLQEPIRMVSAYSQLLQRRYQGKLDEQADQYITYAVQGAQRMEALVRDLLAYTQATSLQEDKNEPVQINTVVDQVLANLQPAIQAKNATIEYHSLPAVNVARIHLVQLFQNLLSNALKYTGESPPHIEIQASRDEKSWRLSVRDNGIGIDPQYKQQIFGLFKRLHTNAEYDGTGIGLAICQKIVERYGGRIWVESALGQGATFYFSLPAASLAGSTQ